MGSLHPANRLAAYITGRVNLPAEIGKRASQKLDPAHKAGAAAVLPRNAAGSAAPSAKAAPAATVELKTAAQLAGKCGARDVRQFDRDSSSVVPGVKRSRTFQP